MEQKPEEPKKVPITKSPWFIPAIVLIVVIVIIFIFVQSKSKTKTPPITTTTISTTSVVHTTNVTITLPPTTVTEVSTKTIPAETTVTKTAIVTSTTLIPTTTTNIVTSTTTITNTLPPVTTTNLVTTTLPVFTTTVPVTTTVTTPVTTTVTTTLPSLTFTTGLAVDGTTLVGQKLSTGFTIITGGTSGLHTLTLSGQAISSPLASLIPFTLQATSAQNTALKSYFGTMSGNIAYQSEIVNQINGTLPYFYLNTSNDLVDGFKYALGITPTTLTINDDYPKGTYIYTGTLIGSNNAILPLTITLIVK